MYFIHNMYFIYNVYDGSEHGMIKDYKELKELYINEIKNDLLDNYTEREIVVCDTNTLVEYAKGKEPTLEDIKENLESYGWKIIDLLQIQRDLEDIKNYFKGKLEYYGKIDEVINIINKGVK